MLKEFAPCRTESHSWCISGGARSRGRTSSCVAICLLVGVSLLLSGLPAGALLGPQLIGKKKTKISRTVTGQVLDGADNPIVGAAVELTDTTAGKKTAIYTEEEGRYHFSDLNANHDYKLQALHNNISSDVRTVSSFDGRDKIIVILRIPPPKE